MNVSEYNEPEYKKFIKRCEEFQICSEIGNAGVIVAEHPVQRDTLYQIVVYGSLKIGKCFESEYVELQRGIHDVKKFVNQYTNFYTYEPFHIYGFNPRNDSEHWNAQEIKESFTCNRRGWLICFDGYPIVNEKELQRMDYALLEEGKECNIDIKDGLLGFFTRI
jgi:hypothetical protein